jgi:hypothetical protein
VNLEALALVRAEEQMRDRWRKPDPDEGSGPHLCVVCEKPVAWIGQAHPLLCPECRADGWTAAKCPGCGSSIKRTDQTGPSKERRGYCKPCRDRWPAAIVVNLKNHRREKWGAWVRRSHG